MSYEEQQESIVTHRGKVEKKSLKHYDASNYSNPITVAQPLVMDIEKKPPVKKSKWDDDKIINEITKIEEKVGHLCDVK